MWWISADAGHVPAPEDSARTGGEIREAGGGMQGSLDQPPVVIRISRIGSLIGFVLCAVMMHFRIYLFGIGLLYFGWQLLDPNTITLAPEGLGWRTSFGRRHWAWNQISNIRALPWGQFGWDVDGKSQSIFGFGWETGTRKLADLMNAARARWSAQPACGTIDPSTENS
jgi:hypothetical protein